MTSAILQKAAEQFENVFLIDCIDFLKKEAAFFSPDGVHPNEEGMRQYSTALCEAMEKRNLKF